MNARNIAVPIAAVLLHSSVMLWTGTAAAAVAPDQVARTTAEDALQEIKSHREALKNDPDKLDQLVESRIFTHFDFDRISRFVLGLNWRQATPEQRARFTVAFQHMLVRSYSHALLEYRNEVIQWEPLNLAPGTQDVVVRSKVIRKDGPPIPINYRMYLTGDEWKVYDLNIDAISLATNYRSAFATEIRKGGLDGLIQRLEQQGQVRKPG